MVVVAARNGGIAMTSSIPSSSLHDAARAGVGTAQAEVEEERGQSSPQQVQPARWYYPLLLQQHHY